jgi:vacuolar-type H+-ATPase subunit E/Vma4
MKHFANMVYQQAQTEKEAVVAEAKAEARKIVARFETERLSEAYQAIQRERRALQKASAEELSGLALAAKRDAAQLRGELTRAVFESALSSIRAFRQTEAYLDFLKKNVQKGLDEVSAVPSGGRFASGAADENAPAERKGKDVIFLDASDAKHKEAVAAAFPSCEVEVLEADDKLLGGSRVFSPLTRRFSDNSIAVSLEAARAAFLSESGALLQI